MTLTVQDLKRMRNATSAFKLIRAMVDPDPAKRPSLKEVLNHSIFARPSRASARGTGNRSTADPDSLKCNDNLFH